MNFYNDAARRAYEQKCRITSREYQREQAARELAAMRERVPEQLGRAYRVIRVSDGQVIAKSDRVSHLAINACATENQIRRAIETGEPFTRGSAICLGGGELYRVVPVEEIL